MQILKVKTKDHEGKEIIRETRVIRGWTLGNGEQIFLHGDGVYGYKDGSPVKSRRELQNILDNADGSGRATKRALDWWDRFGEKVSRTYWDKENERLDRLHETPLSGIEGDISDLDAVLYQRRGVRNRSEKAYTDPSSWHQWFDKRPDWWGFSRIIELGDFYFRRVDHDPEQEETEQEETEQEETEQEETNGHPEGSSFNADVSPG